MPGEIIYRISENTLVHLLIDHRHYNATTDGGKINMVKRTMDFIDELVKQKHIERVKE